MLNLKIIAITGGLSSGKSTVCQIFKELGAYTVSSDEIVHNLLLHDRILQEKIARLLGADVLTNHHLDKEKIAERVFSDREKLKALERLIHPLVFHEISRIYDSIKNERGYPLFIAEVPLLFESKGAPHFDAIITVASDEKSCKERFLKQKGKTEAEFNDRMMRQMKTEEKAARSSHVILNTGTMDDLKKQVNKLYQTFLSQ